MGYNTSTWGTIAPGQTITTGIIWSPFNANQSGGSDQGAQINLANPESNGFSLSNTAQMKQRNLDGTVVYWVTVTCTGLGGGGSAIDFTLQGGGF
jgi:hypothetical protein